MAVQNSPGYKFDVKRRLLRPIIPVLLAVLVLFFLVSNYVQEQMQKDWQDMTDLITVEVLRADGTEEVYNTNSFHVANRGDRVTVHVKLLEERMVKDAVLGFNIPNAAISAYYGDELLYTYGREQAAEGRFVGDIYFRVPLRDEMWGGEIRLELVVAEDQAFSTIRNVKALPEINSVRYFFATFQLDVLIYVAFFLLFILAFVVLLFYPNRNMLWREGIFLSIFCILLGVCFLGTNGFFYLFSDNVALCAHLEYIAFFAMLNPFCLFFSTQVLLQRKHLELVLSFATFFGIAFIVITVLNYTTTAFHYSLFMLPMQILMLIGASIFMFILTRYNYREDVPREFVRYGLMVAMAFFVAEVLRSGLGKLVFTDSWLNDFSLFGTGMLIMAGAMVASWVCRLVIAVGEENDRALLRRMAYVDVLTGISNRAYCHQKIKEMESSGEKYFALLFFDLNGLKWVNDHYGHDMGDRFIQSVADILQNVFGQQHFCGRWGGDEFIVCLIGKGMEHAESMLSDFDEEVKRLNSEGEFKFRISVAHGMVRSTKERLMSMDEAIKEADKRMYTTKIRMYEEEEVNL